MLIEERLRNIAIDEDGSDDVAADATNGLDSELPKALVVTNLAQQIFDDPEIRVRIIFL